MKTHTYFHGTEDELKVSDRALAIMKELVEWELPICEECGNGTFTWEEAQQDPSIMWNKNKIAESILTIVQDTQD